MKRFLLFLLAGHAHLFGIDNNHKITGIHVRSNDRFFLAAQEIGGFDRDATKHLVFGVNDPPFAVDLICFCRKRFHYETGLGGRGN